MIGQTWVILVVSIILWIILFPESTLGIIAGLKQQLRSRLVKRTGEAASKQIERSLLQFALNNHLYAKQIDRLLAEHHDLIGERIGEKWADQILGEAEPYEPWD